MLQYPSPTDRDQTPSSFRVKDHESLDEKPDLGTTRRKSSFTSTSLSRRRKRNLLRPQHDRSLCHLPHSQETPALAGIRPPTRLLRPTDHRDDPPPDRETSVSKGTVTDKHDTPHTKSVTGGWWGLHPSHTRGRTTSTMKPPISHPWDQVRPTTRHSLPSSRPLSATSESRRLRRRPDNFSGPPYVGRHVRHLPRTLTEVSHSR